MTQTIEKQWSAMKLLLVVGLTAVIAGALVGTGVSYGFRYEGRTTRDIYLFNNSLEFNETQFGLPHDTFSPDHITVNKGDTVVVHYANIEDQPEAHTFTIDAPYNVNVFVDQGQSATISFQASYAGVFVYYCTFHTPTMRGYLVVLG